MLSSMDRYIRKRSWGQIVAASLALTCVIFAVDYSLGRTATLGPVYALPIALSAWYAGRDVGLTVAIVAAALSFLAFHQGASLREDSPALALNSLLLLLLYLLVVGLIARARNRLLLEEQLARMDGLTGSLNARAFREELDYHLALAAREHVPLTLAYIDVDDFKQINDRWGHVGGDRVLQAVATTLKEFVRRTDRVTRIGGDEFAVLMPDTDGLGAERIITEARRAFARAFEPGVSHVTCSIGVVTFVGRIPSAVFALATADELMYEVKKTGKGSVKFKTEHMPEAGQERSSKPKLE